jgi:hypothetical protein
MPPSPQPPIDPLQSTQPAPLTPLISSLPLQPKPNRLKPLWITLGVVAGLFVIMSIGMAIIVRSTVARTTSATGLGIVGTPVKLVGSVIESSCFTFTMPKNYILSPNAANCSAEIRLGSTGQPSGEPLTSITVKAEVGGDTITSFFDKTTKAANTAKLKMYQQKTLTINGKSVGFIQIDDSYKLRRNIYFVPDTSGHFTSSGSAITSYMISGPAYNAALGAILDTVINSFTTK